MGSELESEVRALREFILILIRDVAAVRLLLEGGDPGGREAPGVDPEAEKKAEEEAQERARQKEEAFLRMRAEQGKGEEVDEEDLEILSEAWMLR